MWEGGGEGSKNFWGNHLIFRGRGAQKGEIRKDSGGGALKSARTGATLSYWPQVTQSL